MAFRILNDITRWNSRSRRYGCCFRVPGVPGPEAESTHNENDEEQSPGGQTRDCLDST